MICGKSCILFLSVHLCPESNLNWAGQEEKKMCVLEHMSQCSIISFSVCSGILWRELSVPLALFNNHIHYADWVHQGSLLHPL